MGKKFTYHLDLCFRFTVQDDDEDGYKYDVGLCVDALSPAPEGLDVTGVGVVQMKKKGDPQPKIIGRYDKADIMAGRMYMSRDM